MADYRELYEKMGMPEEMVEQSARSAQMIWGNPKAVFLSVLFMIPMLGYFLWTVRYFLAKPASGVGTDSAIAES